MLRLPIVLAVIAACALSAKGAPVTANIAPTHLRCEYLRSPLGIDVVRPRLSWTLVETKPAVRDEVQSAYQILVATSRDRLTLGTADLWAGPRTPSDRASQVEYAGKPLRAHQECWWTVRVWDRAGRVSGWAFPQRWSMGPLSAANWGGSWIEDPNPAPGGNRASSQMRNGYHSNLETHGDATKWVQVDLGKMRRVDGVRLWPARPVDWQADVPGFLFPVRYRIELADSAAGPFRVAADLTAADAPSPGDQPVTHRFAGQNARFVRLTATRLRMRDEGNYALALTQFEALNGDANVALGAAVQASDSLEQGGWSAAKLTDGEKHSRRAQGADALPAPMMRREFAVKGAVKRAIAYVSALGLVELRLNAKRVGENLLAPEWTDYDLRVQYQALDVTKLVKPGSNAVGAWLGDGWYAGRIGLFPGRGNYGRKPKLRLHLRIELADGSAQTVVSDGKWRSTLEGPIRSADILDGEAIDAGRAMAGWDRAGFDDKAWQPAAEVAVKTPLVWQRNEPIRVVQELKPIALTEPKPGVFVYDMGQNMVGWARLRLSGKAGGQVQFRHAEMLNDDGTIYTANLRGAPQIDHYTLAGAGGEVYEPRFTYHGFRYVEVTGALNKPAIGDLTGRVFCSSSPEAGRFECSSPMLTKLMRNAFWTQRANLMSTPTDCPQRDERLGWMGDIQSFSQSAIFNMDMAGFLTKWLQDVRDAQLADGRMPDFAPNPGKATGAFSGVPAWGDAGVVVPWRAWVNYGDKRVLEASFESCRRWLEYIRKLNPDLLWRNGRNNDYNDWLNGDTLVLQGWPRTGGAVPNEVFGTAFFAHSTDLTLRMAEVLGRKKDAAELREQSAGIKAAFNRAYVKPDGTIVGDTQAGYALALHFDLLPEDVRPKAVEHLVAAIHRYHDHISTGIQSTHRMMLELTRRGQTDLAYTLANRTDFPSWGFMIENGATTIWERWDGYVKGRGFQDAGMNSFNHWALGSVVEWLWRTVAGLSPDEAAPGWKRFNVRPVPGGGLTWAKGDYDSPAGPIHVDWRVEGGELKLRLTVPPNTQAVVTMPGAQPRTVGSGGHEFTGRAAP